MLVEIMSATDFLVEMLRMHCARAGGHGLSPAQMMLFKGALSTLLRNRYQEHWFPELPFRGSAYRCIRINGKMDPVIAQAGAAVGLPPSYLRTLFPTELTLWIDPSEVCYRIGENGSICMLYDGSRDGTPSSATEPPVADMVGVNC